MNRHCYRIIFNKARGMLMVVSEAARSCSKAAGQSNETSITVSAKADPSQSRFFRLTSLGLSCLLVNAPLLQYAHADNSQIVADNTASIFDRPTLLVAKNGTPIVDIRGANVRGVSRNVYSQFDIKDNGVILNNSPWGDDTQLAGHIRGNFWIMARPANIIVNEVNSTDPSIFNGKLEVAGRAADVIIANPSGINVNGGEFINAANTTLTTGKIGYTWLGNLDKIKVNQGSIRIGEKGLHESGEFTRDSTFILAKSVELNGQITGDPQGLLQIVVGENDIDYENHTAYISDNAITAHNSNSPSQGVALDIGELGGAYARGIHIIGTDKGMGVTNAGNLVANNFIHISNDGRIENHGRMQAGNEQSTNAVLNLRNNTQNNKTQDDDSGDIINTGTLQAGNTINVQSGRDIISQGKIIRNSNNNQVSEARNDGLNLFAERDLDINHIDNRNTKGDIQLVAKRDLNLADTPQINSQDNILISAGNDLKLTDTKLQSSGDNKSVSLYSNHDLSITRSQIKATGKAGQVITSAAGNQNLTNTNISADALTNRTGDTLTIRQATITNTSEATDTTQTNHSNQDVKLIAGGGIDAQGLTATAKQGNIHLEAASADLLGEADSDIKLTDSSLNAAKNTDIVAERDVNIKNSTLTGEQIRSSAGGNLHLGLTGDNQANKNVYLRAGQRLSIDSDGENGGKLVGSDIEAMASQIELADHTQLKANTGNLKLSATKPAISEANTDSTNSDNNNTDAEVEAPSHDIHLGKNTQLSAQKNISISSDAGSIDATNLNAQADNSIGLVAQGIALKSSDSEQSNQLIAKQGDVIVLDQSSKPNSAQNSKQDSANNQSGIQVSNPDIQAKQGQVVIKSQSDIQLAGDGNHIGNINADSILVRNRNKADTNQESTNQEATNPEQTTPTDTSESIANATANIDINYIKLTAQNKQLVIDADDNLNLHNSQLNAKDNIELHGNDHVSIENSSSNGDKHTAISSNNTLSVSGSHLQTKGVLSTKSTNQSSLKDSQLQAGALLINSDQAKVELGDNLTFTTERSDLLANNPELAGVNGSMTIKSHDDLSIDAGKTINSDGQIDLRSQGKLTLKGSGGNTGNGSQSNVAVTANDDISLTGSQVIVQGSDISSKEGGIYTYATAGDIELQAIVNDIDNVKPENRIAELNDKLAQINQHIDTLNNDSIYQTALNNKKAQEDKLQKLIKDNEQTPIADFEAKRKALEASIATQVSAMNVRVKALNINKTHEELAEEKANNNRSLQIANTPYKGQENYGTHLTAKDNIVLIAQRGVAIDAGQISTQNQAIIRSLTHQQTGRQIIDEQARATFTIPLLKLDKLSNEQRQSYLQQQLALTDSIKFSLNPKPEVNNSERYQKARQRLKDNISAAMQGDKDAQKVINDTLSDAPPVKLMPVAISIEGLHDVYERGNEGDDIYSLHNNHRASSITADKGIIIQATGDRAIDPSTVSSSGAPNNILLGSGDYIAKYGDISISTVGSLIMQAGQDSIYDKETDSNTKRSWGGLKKKVTITTTTEDIRSADPVTLIGNNIHLNAADDIHGYATELKAPEGNTIIKAGEALRLMAVEEVDKKKVDNKKTSRFIGFKYNKDHSTNTRNIASELPSTVQSNITNTESGENTQLQGTKFEYLEGANIKAGVGIKAVDDASIIFTTINETVTQQQTHEFNNVVWQSMSDKGSISETAELPQFTGPVPPTFEAPGGLIVQVPLTKEQQKDNKNLVNVINTMANQPGYGYLKDITKRDDVDFSVIRLAQEDWDYEQEGLTPAGAALLTLAVAWAAGPTAAGIAESVGGVGGAAASAGFTSLSTQAAIALANNKGDIAKTLDDLASSDTVRATLTAALTAGALEYINTTVMPDVFKNLSIEDAKSLQGRLVNGTFEGTTSALVDTAINGGSLSDNLEAALLNSSVNAAHGFAASEIKLALNNDILRIISQAAAGCVAGELKRAECEAGAIGSGVGELAAEIMLDGRNPTFVDDKELQNIIELSKFIAGVSAAYAGYDVNVAIGAANTTVINNGVKDKALLKLENARKYLDDKSKQVLDKFIDAYKKGDIELAKKYKTQLDDAISDWASSGSYEILGVNPKAAVGAAVFAVGELVIPTNVVDVVPVGKLTKAGKALKLTEHAASSFQKSSPIIVSGTRAIDKSSKYEEGVRSLYNNATFSQRQYSVIINGVRVNGVADDVTSISGRLTAVEAKYVDDWNKSIRNPLSSIGDKPWAVSEQNKMVEQARKYSHAFEGGVIYHTNSTELASYYSQVFKASGVSNFKFIISPTK